MLQSARMLKSAEQRAQIEKLREMLAQNKTLAPRLRELIDQMEARTRDSREKKRDRLRG